MNTKEIESVEWIFKNPDDKRNKVLTWELFGDCNYKCKKCFQNIYRDKSLFHFNDVKKLIDNSKKIYKLCKKNNFRRIDILGGEITLLKNIDLLNILKIFNRKKNLIINLYSNFSCNYDYFLPILKQLKNRIELTLSFHKEYQDIKSFFKKATLLLNLLKKERLNTKVTLQLTVNKDNLEDFLFFIKNKKLLCKYYDNITLSFHEELIMNSEHKVISSFNFINYCLENKIELDKKILKYFNRNKEYKITFKNKNIKIGYLPRENISFKGFICNIDAYTVNFLGNLTNVCGHQVLSNNFFNKNVKIKKINNNFKCPSSFCCCSFHKVNNDNK